MTLGPSSKALLESILLILFTTNLGFFGIGDMDIKLHPRHTIAQSPITIQKKLVTLTMHLDTAK